jgi:sugar (pentulose or hexulose) kinase
VAASDELTLVIDIGKSHAKLLMVDDAGTVVERHGSNNASVMSPLGYPALDVFGLEAWMAQTLSASTHTRHCTKVITSTHGAALVALGDEGLAWEPMDYEHDALAASPQLAQAFADASDPFDLSLSPALPAGLNAARQLFAVQHLYPQAWQRTRCILPYPQYWAWLLCGVRANEYSSLGCHTHLWQPKRQDYSDLAQAKGWVALFPPMQPAWAMLGTVLPQMAKRWGLPTHCGVYAGVHDSNACLARYLNASLQAEAQATRLTVVSSGTWTVLMAPGAATAALQAERDMLANVDVLGRATPTARFMGGREFAHLLAGVSPDAGSVADVAHLLATQTMALPSFAAQGGPFSDRKGVVMQGGVPLALADLTDGERAALAALYCALVTSWLVRQLWPDESDSHTTEQRLVVEGPLSGNLLYMGLLAGLLPGVACYASVDELEGTARGAWQLTRWGQPADAAYLHAVSHLEMPTLPAYAWAWQRQVLQPVTG